MQVVFLCTSEVWSESGLKRVFEPLRFRCKKRSCTTMCKHSLMILDVPCRQVEFSGTTRPRHRRRSDASELRMQHSMCLYWAANSCMKLRELIQTIRPSAMRGREETLYENPWPNNLAVREVLTNVLHLPDGDLLTRSRQGNGGEVRVAVAAVVA